MMWRQIHLFRTSIYVAAQLLQRAFNIILLPLLVTQMTPAEFTRYGLLNSLLILLSPIITLNIYLAPARLYFDYPDENQKADLLFTAIIGSIVTSIISLLGIMTILGILHADDPITLGSFGLQALISVIVIVLMMTDFYAVILRIDGKALPFLGISTFRQVSLLGAFIFLIPFTNAFDSYLIALAFSGTIAALVGFFVCRKKIKRGRFRWQMFRPLIRFSLPTVIHMTAWWAILSSGRWIGQLYISLDDLAPYVLVTQITLITNMFSRALFEAQLPNIGNAFAHNDIPVGVRIINVTVLVGMVLIVVLYAGIYIMISIFGLNLPVGYQPTPALILFAFLGAFFDTVYLRAVQINQAMKRNDLQALVTFISGIITILISFLLTYKYGENGLILVFALGIGLQAVLSNIVAQKVLRTATINTWKR